MMRNPYSDPRTVLPLTPAVFHILLALSDREMHGYAIMQRIHRDTGGAVSMGPGTLYGSIKRMLATNLIEECDERPAPDYDDVRRRYYRITDFGRLAARAEAERLQQAVGVARDRRVLRE